VLHLLLLVLALLPLHKLSLLLLVLMVAGLPWAATVLPVLLPDCNLP
jgi:hypothetical protein